MPGGRSGAAPPAPLRARAWSACRACGAGRRAPSRGVAGAAAPGAESRCPKLRTALRPAAPGSPRSPLRELSALQVVHRQGGRQHGDVDDLLLLAAGVRAEVQL